MIKLYRIKLDNNCGYGSSPGDTCWSGGGGGGVYLEQEDN